MARWQIKTINGTTPKTPMGLKVAYYTVDKDSGSNMAGTLIRKIVAHKMKFFLTTPPMKETDMSTFLNLIKPDSLTIVYYDLFDGSEKTGTFYHGDIIVEPYYMTGTSSIQGLYKALDINLIEY